MRIMIAHSQYRWQGGEETTVRNQRRALEERGHEVILHIVENPTGMVNSLGALALAPFNPLEYRSARAAIRDAGPDVVHVHNTWFQLSPAIFKAANDEDVPTVATIQNYRLACPQGQFFRNGGPCTDCLGRFPWPGVRHACYRESRPLTLLNAVATSMSKRSLLSSVGRVVVPSHFAKGLLVRGGLPSERAVVVPNGVPDPGIRPFRPSDSPTALFVGRISSEKGAHEIIDLWSKLDLNHWNLCIIGDGPDLESVMKTSSANVEFLGRVDNARILREMLQARFLIFPSRWFEVAPLTVIEAFAAGLPVVGHRLGSIEEMLSPFGGQLLVDAQDPGDWQRALRALKQDDLVDRVGADERDGYCTSFTLQRHGERLENLYRDLIGSQSCRSSPVEC